MKGTHNLVAVFTPTNGSAKTYTALTFTVGCEITSFAVSGAPGSNPTYDIFTSRSIISLTGVTYTQSPACGYTFTNSFGHTIPSGTAASIIFAGTNVIPSFEIYTTNTSHEAAYTVALTNTITVNAGQGQGSTTSFSPADVSITIDVSNPCKTTTISGITFNPSSITVADGATATAEFSVPGDGVDTANSLTGLCGTKNYAISNASGAVSGWAVITDSSVTAGDKTLTIDPSQYGSHISSTVSETLTITTTFADWGTNSGTTSTIAVTITAVSCDCAALAWTAPTAATGTINIDATDSSITVPAPTSDTSARSSNAAFDACYELSTPCATTGTYASGSIKYADGSASGTTLPSWITWNDGSQTLTINPD